MQVVTRFSIIIPIYNEEKYLNRALKSLYNQPFKNTEFICVINGSTDKSKEICTHYKRLDSRFKILILDTANTSRARNMGIKNSTGEYICFLDADDCFSKNALNVLDDYIKKYEPEIIIHSAKIKGMCKPKWIKKNINKKYQLINDFKPDMIFTTQGVLPFIWTYVIKKTIITNNNLYFDEELYIGEDLLFIISYMCFIKKVLFIKKQTYTYYADNKNSITNYYKNNPIKKIKQHIYIVNKAQWYFKKFQIPNLIFLDWAIKFVYPEFICVNTHEIQNLIVDFVSILTAHDIYELFDQLPINRQKEYIKIIKYKF